MAQVLLLFNARLEVMDDGQSHSFGPGTVALDDRLADRLLRGWPSVVSRHGPTDQELKAQAVAKRQAAARASATARVGPDTRTPSPETPPPVTDIVPAQTTNPSNKRRRRGRHA